MVDDGFLSYVHHSLFGYIVSENREIVLIGEILVVPNLVNKFRLVNSALIFLIYYFSYTVRFISDPLVVFLANILHRVDR